MVKIKLPNDSCDLPEKAIQLANRLFREVNLFVIAHNISDEDIEMATAWVANKYSA